MRHPSIRDNPKNGRPFTAFCSRCIQQDLNGDFAMKTAKHIELYGAKFLDSPPSDTRSQATYSHFFQSDRS